MSQVAKISLHIFAASPEKHEIDYLQMTTPKVPKTTSLQYLFAISQGTSKSSTS